MFEKEIKFIGEFSLTKVKKLGTVVTFEKLANAGLHPAIITYISAELDYMIHRDRQKLLKDSIFDYSVKEVSEHFKEISKEIKLNKKIAVEDISKLILQAVSFNANYVVRPKWSLTKFIYNDQNFIAVEELELMLNYLYYYDYIKNVLTAYISKRKVVQLTITEFDLILNKIDRELFKANSEELINNALHSIADFFNVGGLDKNRIALTSVEILLKEKNLMDYLLRLRRTIPAVSRKKYEISDIKKVLYATKPLKPGSIQSYDSGKMEIVAEPKIEPSVEKMIEDLEMEDSEIVSGEEIVTPPVDEEIIFDEIETEKESILKPEPGLEFQTESYTEPEPVLIEKEDLLPIEEEFLSEFNMDDTPEPELQVKEEPVESIAEEEIRNGVIAELEDDLNELIEKNTGKDSPSEEIPDYITDAGKIKTKENTEPVAGENEDDDLLVFYENELSLIDDDDSDLVIVSEEEVNKTEENTNAIAPDLPEQVLIPEEKSEPIKSEENTITESDFLSNDDFDLSIFDDDEQEPVIDETEAETETSEIHNPMKDENQEEDEDEVKEDQKSELPVEKEIINEMLEDYFRDEKKEETAKGKTESFKLADDEFELEDDEDFESEFNSSLLDDFSMDEHISNVLDEIDDILKEDTPAVNDREKEEPPKEIPKKEEKTENNLSKESIIDQEYDIEKDLFGAEIETEKKPNVNKKTEPSKKIKSTVPKSETPDRGKDFFSYLTKKEMKKIVSTVFGGDDGDLVTTIEKISECSSYKEATEILKGVFFSYRVSPYSKEAVLFTNAVSNFFRQT